MGADAFVKGKRLIDPVTGRVEGDDNDSLEKLERACSSSKRLKGDVKMTHENNVEFS